MYESMTLAATLGVLHTISGPDHYLPFIALSKARKWSDNKTLWITFFSGLGHVGSSVLIGVIGIALGFSLQKLNSVEAFRGDIVGWMLFAFGISYLLFGFFKLLKNIKHTHLPDFLKPKKIRNLKHLNNEEQIKDNTKMTPWILFLIFVFGPCEVLIPTLMFPAYQNSAFGMIAVAAIFGIATISTMLITVYFGCRGFSFIKSKYAEKYFHLAAGLIITISGAGMVFWGL